MTRLVTLHGLVAGCTACGGIWIDHVVGQHVLTASISEHVKAFVRHIAEHATGTPPADYRTAARRDDRCCPGCGNALVAKVVGKRRITLDLCGADGTYFDVREIDAMIVDVEMAAVLAQVDREKRQELLAEKRRDALVMIFDEMVERGREDPSPFQ